MKNEKEKKEIGILAIVMLSITLTTTKIKRKYDRKMEKLQGNLQDP